MAAQLVNKLKTTAPFERVNFTLCELYFNKAVIKKTKNSKQLKPHELMLITQQNRGMDDGLQVFRKHTGNYYEHDFSINRSS